MSPTSYRTAPPRVRKIIITAHTRVRKTYAGSGSAEKSSSSSTPDVSWSD